MSEPTYANPLLEALDKQFKADEEKAQADAAAKNPDLAKKLADEAAAKKAADDAAAKKLADEAAAKAGKEEKIEVNHEDIIGDIVDGKEPVLVKPKAEDPPKGGESEGVRNLRNRLKQVSDELEETRKAASGNVEPLKKQIEDLQTRLAQYDVQQSPEFQRQYDAPLVAVVQKLERIATSAGLGKEAALRILNTPMSGLEAEIGKLPAALQGAIVNLHLENLELAERRQGAISQARQKQVEFAELRRQETAKTSAEIGAIRSNVFRGSAMKLAKENPKFFSVETPEDLKTMQDSIRLAKVAIEGVPGEAPTDTVTRQTEAIIKGARFDYLAKKYADLEAEHAALKASALKHGLLRETPGKGGKPEDTGSVEKSADDLSHEEALEALRRRDFAEGGRFHRAS